MADDTYWERLVMIARRLWLSALLMAVLFSMAGAHVTGAANEATPGPKKPSILIDSTATYRLRPDQGVLHGTLQLTVTRPKDGFDVFDSVLVPLVKGAANTVAATNDGRALQTTVETRLDRPYAGASVQFGHELARGDTIVFHIDFDLTPIEDDRTIVTRSFIYIPIFAIGQSAKVSIELPDSSVWYSAVEASACKRQGAIAQEEFLCTGSSDVYDAAHVQLSDLTGYGTLDITAQTSSGAQTLKLRYLPGDAGWAGHVRGLVTQGLPVLERIIGSPLKIREDFTMLEVQYGELGGYEGIFQCLEVQLCRIGVVEGAADQTVLHELAHLWTTKYDERWLAEGIAEFSAEKAAGELGLPVQQPFGPPYKEPIYLQEWSRSLLSGPVAQDAVLRELAGYRESVLLFEDIEKAAGLGAIQQANAKSEAQAHIDSSHYLDFLEAASSTDLTPLFRERVFPPSFSGTLQIRTQAKQALAGLMYFTANSQYPVQPAAIAKAIAAWDFFAALDAVDHALTYIKDYPLALAEKKHMSLWKQFGLIGKDPAGDLTKAKAAFDKADYIAAGQKAQSAENDYSTASQSARDRTLLIFAALVVIGVLFLGATWARHGLGEPEQSGGDS